MLPSVQVNKAVFSSGTAPPSPFGILAIVAGALTGTMNQVGSYADSAVALSNFSFGSLVEYGAYTISVADQPFLGIRCNTTNAGTYSAFTAAITGTSVVSVGSTQPIQHFEVEVQVVQGGTVGAAGLTCNYSLDGTLFVGPIAIPSGATPIVLNLPLPNQTVSSGVSFSLGAGILGNGDSFGCYTERPLANDADVLAALNALALSRQQWEGVYIDSLMTSNTIALVDAWLTNLEASGQFHFAILNTRYKIEPQPTGETEAAYATAMQTLIGSSTSIRLGVGGDGGHVPSLLTALDLKQPAGLIIAARLMATDIGTDPGFVDDGPLDDVSLAANDASPLDHDEDLYPTLDSLRLMSLRSFAPGGPQGAYCTNANTMQASGGDWPYMQIIRIGNAAARVAWAMQVRQLGRKVRKQPADPNTGKVYILEPDAALIDSLINDALGDVLDGQVTSYNYRLSRTDDLSATPFIATSTLEIVRDAYIKGMKTQLKFVKTLTTKL